jgi:hypothetical protein
MIVPSSFAGHGMPCPYCGEGNDERNDVAVCAKNFRFELRFYVGTGRNACATGRRPFKGTCRGARLWRLRL